MDDYGIHYRDHVEKILEIRLQKAYTEAQKDILRKLNEFTKDYRRKEHIMLKQLETGEISRREYEDWLYRQVFAGAQWESKLRDIAETLTETQKETLKLINSKKVDVFSQNANYQAYLMEHELGKNFGFDLYDESTVKLLIKEKPDLLPLSTIDPKKYNEWNKGIISNCVTQGIIQGESIPKIAARIANKTANRNNNLSTTYARTAMTSAQNAGRMEMLRNAKEMHIEVQKKWMSTHDKITRDSHVTLDGQVREVEKPFDSDFGEIMFPGDPKGKPGDVYNCRCTIVYVYPKYKKLQEFDDDNEVRDEKYEEWLERKREVKRKNEKEETDVTESFLKSGTPGKGKIRKYDGFDESREEDKKEKEKIANLLLRDVGGNITMLKDTTNQRMADFYWDGRYWELKSPQKATSVKAPINSGKGQIRRKPGGIILNYGDMEIDIDQIVSVASDIMKFLPFESNLMIVNKDHIVKVIRYKKKK